MPASTAQFPLVLHRATTANGGDEWSLYVNGERVGQYGIFTDPGKTPAEMLPRVLREVVR